MAFVNRGEKNTKSKEVAKEVLEFDTFLDQAIYAIKYLNEKYGEDIYDDNRKPARHIPLANNPNYVGGVGETISESEHSETTNQNLLNFLKTQ